MTRKTRNILFLSSALFFILITPIIVFYSLGWRIDWRNKKIIQPGILYLRVWPKSARIYLNGKLEKKTDFFFGSALIENLLPKKYNIEIKKEGFQIWKKTLEIEKRLATEAKNIVLVPENLNLITLSKNIEKFFLSSDEKKIILQELITSNPENPNSLNDSSWALKIFELDKNIKSHFIEERKISKEKTELVNLKFSPDSKKILLEVSVSPPTSQPIKQTSVKIKYYILDLDKTPPFSNALNLFDSQMEDIYFDPNDSQKLFFLNSEGLNEINLSKNEASASILKNIVTFSIYNENIYYIDSSGFLFKTNSSFSRKDKLNINNFALKKEATYKIIASNSFIFLKEDNILYKLDNEKKVFEKAFEPVNDLKFGPDSKKIVFFNDHEIWILFLEEKNDQPQKKVGEKLFLTRFSEKIDKVFWFTNHYLIFNVGNKIKVVEIDDRDKINIFDLSIGSGGLTEINKLDILWSQTNKKIFILTEKNLYHSERLIP